MKKSNILAVIGSGSTYTPELIDGIIKYKDSICFKEIRLMDIDIRKLTIVGNLCKRMIEAEGLDCKVIMTDVLDDALVSADFVVAQIRVGRLPARILDEKIPLKYGLIGQETTGIGGFFKALRTVPVMVDIAKRMERLCPDAYLINFSNPSGIVTQAIHNNTSIKVIGLCNVPINMVDSVSEYMELQDVTVEYVGLNHLSWLTKITSDGKDYLQEAIEKGINATPMKNIQAEGFSSECMSVAGGIPSTYLEYFYNRNKKLNEELSAEKVRGEVCMEIEEELLKIYEDSALHVKPAQLDQRGGAKYSMAAISLIDSIANDKNDTHIVGVKNGKTLPFLHENDIIEVSCLIGKHGAAPIEIKDFDNEHIIELMQVVKAYERHTVKAALTGDNNEALRALMINPLIGDFNAAKACFEELKEAHKEYLPAFFN